MAATAAPARKLERDVMKQNVVDVLMYLFENFIGDETAADPERDFVINRLEQLGFPQHEIIKAFDWLEDLADVELDEKQHQPNKSIRIYSDQEKLLINTESICFLIYMEENNILTPATRELVMDKVAALDTELDTEQLKWIVMIVLYSYPGEENAYAYMENMVFDQIVNYMH